MESYAKDFRDRIKALLLRPRCYCGRDMLFRNLQKFTTVSSSTAVAAGGRTSCRTSQNLAAIGALLYDPRFLRKFECVIKWYKASRFTGLFNTEDHGTTTLVLK